MNQMLQSKDNWLNGYKNKAHTYSVDKGPTSDVGLMCLLQRHIQTE